MFMQTYMDLHNQYPNGPKYRHSFNYNHANSCVHSHICVYIYSTRHLHIGSYTFKPTKNTYTSITSMKTNVGMYEYYIYIYI